MANYYHLFFVNSFFNASIVAMRENLLYRLNNKFALSRFMSFDDGHNTIWRDTLIKYVRIMQNHSLKIFLESHLLPAFDTEQILYLRLSVENTIHCRNIRYEIFQNTGYLVIQIICKMFFTKDHAKMKTINCNKSIT